MAIDNGKIVIIGAGAIGSSVAYHLSRMTKSDIVLIDKQGIAAGTTAYSTAVVRTHYSNEIVAKIAFESRKFFETYPTELGFYNTGMVQIAPENLKEMMFQNVNMLKRIGIREEIIDPEDMPRRFSFLKVRNEEIVAYEPDSGYADPVATTNYFASKAIQRGVKFMLTTVNRISGNSYGAVVTTSDGKEISADKVIVCTNVWTNKLLMNSLNSKSAILPIKVSPHPVIIYKRVGSSRGKLPVIADLYNKDYYKPEAESLLLGGSIRAEMDEVDVDPDSIPPQASLEYVSEYSERLVSRIPAMKDAGYHSTYSAFYDNSLDGQPIIDSLESVGLENVYCGVGLSGHGFKLSPVLGELISKLVLSVEDSNLKYFRLSRFKKEGTVFRKYLGIGTIG
ncbi:MAG: FAD-binding oxidoreductase [Candidatus Parvarchaeota archaeon]